MASIEYAVRATDLASIVFAKIALSADGLDQQLEDLGKRVAEPEVDLKDAAFTQGMIRCAERIDKLSAAMAEPGVDLKDTRFQAEIFKINAQLDRLDKRRVTATVEVKTDRNRLGGGLFGLLGGAGQAGILGGGSATAQGGGGAAGALGPIGIGALIAGAVALLPALLPAALGLGVGGGAAGGALLMGSKAEAQLLKLQTSLQSATGANKRDIQQQIATLRRTQGGVLGVSAAGQNVFGTALSTFSGALAAQGPGFSGGPGGHPAGESFLQGLVSLLKQVAGFTKTLQPMLGDLFRASLPYLGQFVKFLEQATKLLLPVFTQMLRQMTPYLPLIFKGLMEVVKGFAGFLQALGPQGMQASAKIFVALSIAIEYALKGLGIAVNWLVKNIPVMVHDIAKWFDWLIAFDHRWQHETFVIFDGVRHDIAHIWDQIFSNTIGTVIRLAHNVATQFNSLRHSVANIYDSVRHDIASAWDAIWNNTVGRAQRGVNDVVGWFQKLPGRVLNALFGLGHSLYAFAHAALNEFLDGLKSIGGSITSWLSGLWHNIVGLAKKILGVFSPSSVFYDIGKNLMVGLFHGIRDHAHHAVNAAKDAAMAVRGGPSGPGTHGSLPWLESLWKGAGGPAGLAHLMAAIAMAESGGNPAAYNASGATGLWQILGAVDPRDQPFLRNPQVNAHEAVLKWRTQGLGAWVTYTSGAYKSYYDRGGWLPPGVSLAVNATGRPERVLGPGEGGNITVNVHVSPLASPADTGRKVAEVLAEFKKRGGWVYKPGGF